MNFKTYIKETFVRPESGSEKDVMKSFFQSVKYYTLSGLKKLFPNDTRIDEIEKGIARRTDLINAQDECIDALRRFEAAGSEVAVIDSAIKKFSTEMMHALVKSKQADYRTMIVIRKGIERTGYEKVQKEPEAITSVEVLKKSQYFTADVLLEKITEFYTNRGDEKLEEELRSFVARLKQDMDPDVSQDVSWTPTIKSYPLSSVLKKTKTSEQDIVEGKVMDILKKTWKWVKDKIEKIIGDIQTRTQKIEQDRTDIQQLIEKN